MPEYQEILYEKQRGGVLITLNRPEALNAITRSMLKEMHHALAEAEADPEVRAIVLTGAGRAFSSGFDQRTTSGRRRDMQWPYGMPTDMSTAELLNYWRVDDAKLMHIFELTKPVIGAIRGWAMGGGCWLALFTHITIAADDAVFAQPEVRHGSNTSFMWTLLAGFKNALRYSLAGRWMKLAPLRAPRLISNSATDRFNQSRLGRDRKNSAERSKGVMEYWSVAG